MFASLVLQLLHRVDLARGFAWAPAVDLSDRRIYSTLLERTNY